MFVWFNKNNDLKNPNTRCDHGEEHQRQLFIDKPRISFVFSWYKLNHCSIIVLVLGSSPTYSPRINHSSQDSLTKSFFQL